jgi:hypothetical protein
MTRSKSSPPSPPDSFELTLTDVSLLTAGSHGEVAVPGLKVVVDHLGLTVIKPDGAVGAVLSWGKLLTLRTAERIQMPSGMSAVVVEAVSDRRTHRFTVPTDDPEGLEAVVAQVASSRTTSVKPAASSDRPRWWQLRRS